ncbi:MAG: hypothetical protein WDN45_18430 [Caulobacteraceae bacterium]
MSIHGMPEGREAPDLQALVAKLITAFLEARWQFPKRFEQMNPFAFVLSDPQTSKLDKRALKALAAELQLKLFGAEGEGEVSLLVFEGPEVEVHRFARLVDDDVIRFMDGEPLDPPLEGRIERISANLKRETSLNKTGDLVREAIEKARKPSPPPPPVEVYDDLEFGPADEPAPPPPVASRKFEPVFTGLYLTAGQSFIGNFVMCRRTGAKRAPSLLDPFPIAEMSVEAFDEGCVEAAVWALSHGSSGLLFIPMSFSSLVRPAGRRAYARFLCNLPTEHKARLGAAIYDTPRDPSFFALSTIRRFLEPFVSEINLQISDPDFEIGKIPAGAIGSVTFLMPDRDPVGRMNAVRRFLQSRAIYKKKRVWPGVSPVLNQAELDMCLSLRTPVVSGPAVAPPSLTPIPVRNMESDRLPLII